MFKVLILAIRLCLTFLTTFTLAEAEVLDKKFLTEPNSLAWIYSNAILADNQALIKSTKQGSIYKLDRPFYDGTSELPIMTAVNIVKGLLKWPGSSAHPHFTRREQMQLLDELVDKGLVYGFLTGSFLTEKLYYNLKGMDLHKNMKQFQLELDMPYQINEKLEKTLIIASTLLALSTEAKYKKIAFKIQSQLKYILLAIYADLLDQGGYQEAQDHFATLIVFSASIMEKEFYTDQGEVVSDEKVRKKIAQLLELHREDYKLFNKKIKSGSSRDLVAAVLEGAIPSAMIVPIAYILGLGAMGLADAINGSFYFTSTYFAPTDWISNFLNNPFLMMIAIGAPSLAVGTFAGVHHYYFRQPFKKEPITVTKLRSSSHLLQQKCEEVLSRVQNSLSDQ